MNIIQDVCVCTYLVMTTQVVYGRQRELIFQTVCQLCMTLHQPLFLTGLVCTVKQDAILQRALGALHNNRHLYKVYLCLPLLRRIDTQQSGMLMQQEFCSCVKIHTDWQAVAPHLLLPQLDHTTPCNIGTLLHMYGREGLHLVQPTTACTGPEPAQTQVP